MEIQLKYGCNPNQTHAKVITPLPDGPLQVVNGTPSFINLLDGLRSWQLVRDLKYVTNKPAAASYKHVSPAGAAVARELSDAFKQSQFLDPEMELSPIATAYARARSSDRVASFGDFIAVSEPVDVSLAKIIKPEVSDGIIAPYYEPEALELLKTKKKGRYVILQMDPQYQPPSIESRVEFGITLEQSHNDIVIDESLFVEENIPTQVKTLDDEAIETAIVTTITLKHTQSNSVAVGYQGQAVGIGAGQQSRIACTRLACDKSDRWFLKLHDKARLLQFVDGLPRSEKVNAVDQFVRWDELGDLERKELAGKLLYKVEPFTEQEKVDWLATMQGAVLSSDAFFPFRDNIDRAARSGCGVVVQAGGSARDEVVIEAANDHNMAMVMTGVRLFLH